MYNVYCKKVFILRLNSSAAGWCIRIRPNKTIHITNMPLCDRDRRDPETIVITLSGVWNTCIGRQLEQVNSYVFYEPTDRRKAAKALRSKHNINYASPNFLELQEMARGLNPTQSSKNCDIAEIVQLSKTLSTYINLLIITLGSNGVITIKNNIGRNKPQYKDTLVKIYSTVPLEAVENVSGAGDSFSSGVIHGILSGLKESECIAIGFKAAKETLMAKNTVSSNLSNIQVSDLKAASYRYLHI